jgi:hypothetical protein
MQFPEIYNFSEKKNCINYNKILFQNIVINFLRYSLVIEPREKFSFDEPRKTKRPQHYSLVDERPIAGEVARCSQDLVEHKEDYHAGTD